MSIANTLRSKTHHELTTATNFRWIRSLFFSFHSKWPHVDLDLSTGERRETCEPVNVVDCESVMITGQWHVCRECLVDLFVRFCAGPHCLFCSRCVESAVSHVIPLFMLLAAPIKSFPLHCSSSQQNRKWPPDRPEKTESRWEPSQHWQDNWMSIPGTSFLQEHCKERKKVD